MKKVFSRFLFSLAALVLLFAASACRNRFETTESFCAVGFSCRELERAEIVVNHAAPGRDVDGDGLAYPYSGVRTSNVIYSICRDYNRRTQLHAAVFESADAMIADLKARGVPADYVVFAVINNWEDHATKWNGVPDRIDVGIGLYRVRDGLCVAFERFSASSRWPVSSFGSDKPQALLEKPIKEILAKWFNRPISKRLVDSESAMLHATIR